jgi:DNA-binding PadR family transcriptional regulator
MIEQELLLLGLLRESPQHGYNIKTKIKEILSFFAGLEVKSIYYPLRVLEKKGLVIKRISKPGRRPERIVYELTPKGLERFNKLLSKSLLNFKRPQFNLDLSLYFLHYMKPSIARRRLSARLHILDKISQELKLMVKSSERKKGLSLWRILDHNLGMLEAEKEFLTSLIKSI